MSDLTPTEQIMLQAGYVTSLINALNSIMDEMPELETCTITPHKTIIGITVDRQRRTLYVTKPFITFDFQDGRAYSFSMETLPHVVNPMFASDMVRQLRLFLSSEGGASLK